MELESDQERILQKTLTAGTLLLNTADGEVKISINRDGAEFAGEILRKLKNEAK